jgi:hypothetical protein
MEGVSVVLFEVINLCPHDNAAGVPEEYFLEHLPSGRDVYMPYLEARQPK